MMPVTLIRSNNARSSAAGFTLVELITAVSIVSILILVATSSYKDMVLKAKQVEAQQTLRLLLAKSGEDGSPLGTIHESACPVQESSTGQLYCVLSRVSANNCNVPNPFGFAIGDCRTNRYHYWYVSGNRPGEFVIFAVGENEKLGCASTTSPHQSRDRWAINSCGRLTHFVRITNAFTCAHDNSALAREVATDPATGEPYFFSCNPPP